MPSTVSYKYHRLSPNKNFSAEDSYISNLSRSLSLVLDDFYTDLRAVGFSSVTGEGLDELLKTIGDARKEYYEEFLPDLKRKKEKAQARREREAKKQIDKLKQDLVRTYYCFIL